MKATIYHNPKCSTSRKVLEALQQAGITPTIVEYLKTPLDVPALQQLLATLHVPAHDIVRAKEAIYQELDLDHVDDATLLQHIAQHPVLLQRPIVITEKGAAVCRPAETIASLL